MSVFQPHCHCAHVLFCHYQAGCFSGAEPQYGRVATDLRTVLAHPRVVALLLHQRLPQRAGLSLLETEVVPILLLMQVRPAANVLPSPRMFYCMLTHFSGPDFTFFLEIRYSLGSRDASIVRADLEASGAECMHSGQGPFQTCCCGPPCALRPPLFRHMCTRCAHSVAAWGENHV